MYISFLMTVIFPSDHPHGWILSSGICILMISLGICLGNMEAEVTVIWSRPAKKVVGLATLEFSEGSLDLCVIQKYHPPLGIINMIFASKRTQCSERADLLE